MNECLGSLLLADEDGMKEGVEEGYALSREKCIPKPRSGRYIRLFHFVFERESYDGAERERGVPL